MKFSEAVVLGALVTDPKPFNIDHCVIGMAANAVGIPAVGVTKVSRTPNILEQWPWLNEPNPWLKATREVYFLSRAHWPVKIGEFETPWEFIAMTFNFDVCRGKMQLADLLKYIKRMEPNCGDCNRFNCHCHDLFSGVAVTGGEAVYGY